MARLALEELAVTIRAPSMTLALARIAALDQSPRRSRPDSNDPLEPPPDYSPFRRSRASTGAAGPLEQTIRDRRIFDPIILLRAAALDNAAECLIDQIDTTTLAIESSERRENWQRAVRRAALLADESFPLSPVTRLSADTRQIRSSTSPDPSAVLRTSSSGRLLLADRPVARPVTSGA